jgi:hypothetical protein
MEGSCSPGLLKGVVGLLGCGCGLVDGAGGLGTAGTASNSTHEHQTSSQHTLHVERAAMNLPLALPR